MLWGLECIAQSREPVLFPFKQSNTILIKVAGGFNLDNDESFEVIGIAAQVDAEGRVLPRTSYLVHLEESPLGDFNLLWRYNLPGNLRGDFVDLKLTDLDQDEHPELVAIINVSDASGVSAPWLYVFGYDEEFSATPQVTMAGEIATGVRPRPTYLDIGDLDGDGRSELVLATAGAQRGVVILSLVGDNISDGLQVQATAFDLRATRGVQPFCARIAKIDGPGTVLALLGGAPQVSLELYTLPLQQKPIYCYTFENIPRDEFDLGNLLAGDLDGDGWDEFLIALKSGGAYLGWLDNQQFRVTPFFPKGYHLSPTLLTDLNGNRIGDLLALKVKGSEILRAEFNLSGNLPEWSSYTISSCTHPLLNNLRLLSVAPVFNNRGVVTGAIIAPFFNPAYHQHGLVYWWLEEQAQLSTTAALDTFLQGVDSTLAAIDTVVSKPQESLTPRDALPLSESERLRRQLEGIAGTEIALATLPLGDTRKTVTAVPQLPKPDILTHPGESIQYPIEIPGLSLEDTKNLNVQIDSPPGMRFDLANKTFYWVPADTQLGWHRVNATFSWLGNKESRSFSIYVNHRPRIVSTLPARDVIQIGEIFNCALQVEDLNKDAIISYRLIDAPGGATINAKGEIVWKPSFDQVDWYDFLIEVSDGYDTAQLGFALFVNHPVSIESTAPVRTAIGQQYSYAPRIIDNNKGFYVNDYTLSPRITDWKQTGIVEIRILEDAIRNNIARYIERYRKTFPLSADPNSKALFQDIFEDSNKVVFVYNLPVAQNIPLAQIVNTFFSNLNMTPPRYTTPNRRYLYKFSLKEAPQGMQMAGDGTIVWTPGQEQYDYQSFAYTVTDGFFSAEEHAQVYVNYPPKIVSQPDTTAFVNTLWQYEVKVRDLNTDSQIRYELLKAPDGMVISPQGIVTWRPTDLQLNQQFFTLRVTDGMAQDVQRGRVFVNAKPRILSIPKPVAMADIKYEYQLEAEDPNGGRLTYRAIRLPKYANFDPQSGLLTWTPRKNQKGVNDIVLEVRDPQGWNTLQEFQVHVFHNPSSSRLSFLRDTISLLALIGVIYLVVR